MLAEHNPVFVEPTMDNLRKLHGQAVVMKFSDGSTTSGEPYLYCRDVQYSGQVLLKWAYERRLVDVSEIAGIAPRYYDTLEEMEQ